MATDMPNRELALFAALMVRDLLQRLGIPVATRSEPRKREGC